MILSLIQDNKQSCIEKILFLISLEILILITITPLYNLYLISKTINTSFFLTFITFEDERDAEDAMYNLDRTRFMGRELEVEMARGDRKSQFIY